MDKSKYIVIEYMGIETPILFPNFVEHSEMGITSKVISAGFFEVGASPTKEDSMDIDVSVFGKSTTLDKKSRKEDAALIKRLLRR